MPLKPETWELLSEREVFPRRRPVLSPAVIRLLCSPPQPLDVPFYALSSSLGTSSAAEDPMFAPSSKPGV